MAITFECANCGKSFTTRDEFAGKTGQCKQCGHRMTIPEPDSEGYGLDLAEGSDGEAAPPPPRASAPMPSSSSRRPLFERAEDREPKKGFFSFGNNEKGGLAAGLLVVAAIGF